MSGLYDPRTDPLHWTRQTTVTKEQLQRMQQARSAETERGIKQRQERDAARAAEKEATLLEEGRARLAAYEGQAHQRFLHNGGSEADWRSAWPAMKSAWLIEQSADPREQRVQEQVTAMRDHPRYSQF